jgi:hypothetical protein
MIKLLQLLDKLQRDLTDVLSSVESLGLVAVLFLWGTTVTSPKSMFIIQLPLLRPSRRPSPPLQKDALRSEIRLSSTGCSNNATDQTPNAETQLETSLLKLHVSGQPTPVSTSETTAYSRDSLSASTLSRACVRWIMEHSPLKAIRECSVFGNECADDEAILPLHILVHIPVPNEDSERSFLDTWQPRQAISSQLDILAFSSSPSSSAVITARPARVGLALRADGSISTLDDYNGPSLVDSVWLSWKDRIHGFTD